MRFISIGSSLVLFRERNYCVKVQGVPGHLSNTMTIITIKDVIRRISLLRHIHSRSCHGRLNLAKGCGSPHLFLWVLAMRKSWSNFLNFGCRSSCWLLAALAATRNPLCETNNIPIWPYNHHVVSSHSRGLRCWQRHIIIIFPSPVSHSVLVVAAAAIVTTAMKMASLYPITQPWLRMPWSNRVRSYISKHHCRSQAKVSVAIQ